MKCRPRIAILALLAVGVIAPTADARTSLNGTYRREQPVLRRRKR